MRKEPEVKQDPCLDAEKAAADQAARDHLALHEKILVTPSTHGKLNKPCAECPKTTPETSQPGEKSPETKQAQIPKEKETQAAEKPLKGILKKPQGDGDACCTNLAPPGDGKFSGAEVAQYEPEALVTPQPVPESNEPQEKGPCYLPRKEDVLPLPGEKVTKNLGPWAEGREDWGALGEFTGTRPVVDKYTVERYSEGEWRAHNKHVLDKAVTGLHKSNL